MAFDPLGALASIAGGVGGFFLGGPMGAAIGSGLATTLYTGDIGRGVMSGLMGYGLGGIGSAIGQFGAGAGGALAGEAGKELAKNAVATGTAEGFFAPVAAEAGGSMVPFAGSGAASPLVTGSATGSSLGGASSLLQPAASAGTDWSHVAMNIPNNITNPDALWSAVKQSPMGVGSAAMGLGSLFMNGDQKSPPPPQQMYYGKRTQYVPRTYTPKPPDPYGREQEYYQYAKGGWIKDAIKKPGALTKQAHSAGMSPMEFARAHKHDSGTTGKRARLALTLQGFDGGGPVYGAGGGLDDAIPAVINNRTPARLSSGEYVVPAHAVSAIGDGSTEAGVRQLDAMVDNVMEHKYGTTNRKPNPMNAEVLEG